MKSSFFIKFGLLLIIVGVSSTSFEVVSSYIGEVNKDVKTTNTIIDSIDKNYNNLNRDVTSFKDDLEDTYSHFNMFLEEFPVKKNILLNDIKNTKLNLGKIYLSKNNLDKECSKNLNRQEQKEKCEIYTINTDNATESYKKLVDKYNYIVGKYNKYAKKNKINTEKTINY